MLGLKHFRQDGCLTYLVYDLDTREAAIIDPNAAMMGDYREVIAENQLKLRFAVDTHTHADHFSGTHLFRSEYGSEVVMSPHTRSERATRRLAANEAVRLGKQAELTVLETPGHTPDSICVLARAAAFSAVFTGDTLFLGSSGRTDFPGADPARMWESIDRVLGGLPGETLVYPGHDYNDLLFSTIETERRKNAHWRLGREEFIALKKSELIPNADLEIRKRIEFNLAANPATDVSHEAGAATACGAPSSEPDRAASISVEKYKHKLEEKAGGTRFIDVREPFEYRESHIPGVENIPLSELGLRLKEIGSAKRVYVSCLSGRRSSMAARTLVYLGLPDVVNVTGGFKAWLKAGYRSEQ